MTVSELNRRLYGDAKRNTVARELIRRGLLMRNGRPTAQQIALGNFRVGYVRAAGSSGKVKAKVVLTPKGIAMVVKMLGGSKKSTKGAMTYTSKSVR